MAHPARRSRDAHPVIDRWRRRLPPPPILGIAAAAVVFLLVIAVVVGSNGAPSDVAATFAPSPSNVGLVPGASSGSSAPGASVPGLAPSGDASSAAPGASNGPAPSVTPLAASGPFGPALLIADRGNGRLLIVDPKGRILWRFPVAGSLRPGQYFSADDAFMTADGTTIVANEEEKHVVVKIDVATRRIVWQYGTFGVPGAGPNHLDTPDDAYPLPNGDITVADIRNCRIIEISPSKRIVRQWGRTGVCRHDPPYTYSSPNGDTPLPDGGMLITEIGGSHVVRLSASGTVLYDVHAPVGYPSDAQLDANGNIVVADYSSPGAVVAMTPTGTVLWRWDPRSGGGRLDHPSLAVPLPNGDVILNDDFRQRVIVIDPATRKIVWQFGRTDVSGRGAGELSTPDGLEPLAGFPVLY
ncbi:MAG: outer membrane protein assembly factor BamB family protein [Candidatus Limnocylindrales bacterium]